MKKPVTKIICATLATVVAAGISAAAGCSPYNKSIQLSGEDIFTADKAVSNGGFAVEKGGYVYFINGVTDNTADNTYGTPDKGAIKRISKKDLAAHNYASAETVVPQISYSGNNNAGLFIYGDYIYYSTPSNVRDAEGNVRNGELELKSAKLDGTESIKNAYITFPDASYDFRFVEEGGEVYALYAATGETLFGESSGVTNLHSLKLSSGVNTLLAYDVASYKFDAEDKTNPVVVYTMGVSGFETGSSENYNQLYKVSASQTVPNEYDTGSLVWWKDGENRYVNCGQLVFDGIGGSDATSKTPFNYEPGDKTIKNDHQYTYTLEAYVNGNLFYTRHTPQNSSEYLYSVKLEDAGGENYNPVTANPAQGEGYILESGTTADSFKYIFGENGSLEAVLYSESSGGISINRVKDGALSRDINNETYYRIVRSGSATILNIDTQNGYVYYSLTGGNGYTFYRVKYTGGWRDYDGMFGSDEVNDFTPVRILDLDASSDWYNPEFIAGNILFASETDNMADYNYIMAFDLTEDGNVMDNNRIDALNKQYDKIIGTDGIIAGYADADKYETAIYANLSDAARYLFYTADKAYVDELATLCNAEVEEGADLVYSDSTLKKLSEFLAPAEDNDWKDYCGHRNVNGQEVYANRRDYYYSVLGTMTEEDADALMESFRAEYLVNPPEEEPTPTWWDGLNTAARALFITGMCILGVLAVGGIVIGCIALVRKARTGKAEGGTRRRRIKVDTTDDKNIDVYGQGGDGKEE